MLGDAGKRRELAGAYAVEQQEPAARPGVLVLLRIFSASIAAGVAVGILGSLFRIALDTATRWRESLVDAAQITPVWGFMGVVAATAGATIAARYLVLAFAPVAAGSGVQHVEAVIRGEAAPAGLAVLPVKFLGGLLAIGAGLPLGREGPTVQMGAVLGDRFGSRLLQGPDDRKAVFAAGAGAGLGVAFNTPIGAAVFVFEELTRRFVPIQVLATLSAAAIAMAVMRFALGDSVLFQVEPGQTQPLAQLPVHFALGAVLGLLGAGYGRLTTLFLDAAARLRQTGSLVRAGVIGAVVGAVGWFFPQLIGGGEVLVQSILNGQVPVLFLVVGVAVRLVLCPLSYAAGVPGGLFAPLLVLGAAGGTLASLAAQAVMPELAPSATAMVVVGMAAIFTAVVRAPLTGVVMTIEMTGRADCALPMLTACLAATLFASFAGGEPIYDTLRKRMLAGAAKNSGAPP
jgi:CIC family chloride channel protein